MSTLLQFQYHLTTSSPNSRPCSLLPPKNQHLFVANQRLHSLHVDLKIYAKRIIIVRAKDDSDDESDDDSDDESKDEAPVPPKRPPFEWKKWAVGVLFFFILPSYRLRMGPFAILKDKVDEMFETAETAAAVVEDLAELVDRLAEEAEKKLPDGTKLDDLARSIENLAERVDEKAEQAQELIKEVQNMAEDLEDIMETKIIEATRREESHHKDRGRRIHRPEDENLKDGAETIESLTEQAEKRAEETQELVQQVDKLGSEIRDMDSRNPAATSGSQKTGHENRSGKRLTKV
ncbi:uncharacterized protein LOC108208198 [Daucus carota subsp. sativus]|uniref:uncharacterized protein LOC108208198 n=1 Tax=Daucus carota subsp. sativus TaxID=79200 RepID=UPI0007B213D0|nr:PREDICTED: uncharacterized protein LOC108208198 [Daucus carota subsp. sativus]